MDISRKQKFAFFTYEPSIVTPWSFENSPVQPTVFLESSSNNDFQYKINSIQFNIAFNIKSILYTVNYMIIRKMTMLISNIHNITPNMVSYLQIYVLKISLTELIL